MHPLLFLLGQRAVLGSLCSETLRKPAHTVLGHGKLGHASSDRTFLTVSIFFVVVNRATQSSMCSQQLLYN